MLEVNNIRIRENGITKSGLKGSSSLASWSSGGGHGITKSGLKGVIVKYQLANTRDG